MGIEKTLGGDRLGSGKRQKIHMHGYERSTQDLGYLWRSTMAAGTLVPFMSELALPGDTFDINLNADIKTHPTIGPLFGSYKIQLDVFQAPIRLYQGQLHNNKLGIGLNMGAVKLPLITLEVDPAATITDIDNTQINSSCILSYLGIRGIGMADPAEVGNIEREFNGIPLLAYWDIYKNYYANKQEEIGYVLHYTPPTPVTTLSTIVIFGVNITQGNTMAIVVDGTIVDWSTVITSLVTNQPLDQIVLLTSNGNILASSVIINNVTVGLVQTGQWSLALSGPLTLYGWDYISAGLLPILPPNPVQFDLSLLDDMRENILAAVQTTTAFDINAGAPTNSPYDLLLNNGETTYSFTQEGLGLKTYQSDLFNNWLSTDWIDGPGGINDITAIDTTGGSINIDTIILARKVYDMLNRIAVSGGTYDDWLDTVYDHERYWRAETPIYHGGLSKELIFQEVVSNSESSTGQPLGTLAGKGTMAGKHKGGNVTIKVDEPSYLIGIISLTPRVDYSQGNKWDTGLLTMDDFHKPGLDQIGFQELITEQMAWWTTQQTLGSGTWTQRSAGKQPAWISYMTNVNQTRGNFAIADNEMFMTLNRRYEWNEDQTDSDMIDLTTYIDPSKYNFIFAETAIDAQNFWAQISVDITARRKLSAKVMPNL